MNLYRVKRVDRHGWDEWDAFVAAAENWQSARDIHPSGSMLNWDQPYSGWVPFDQRESLLTVERLGTTHLPEGVILASFNAG